MLDSFNLREFFGYFASAILQFWAKIAPTYDAVNAFLAEHQLIAILLGAAGGVIIFTVAARPLIILGRWAADQVALLRIRLHKPSGRPVLLVARFNHDKRGILQPGIREFLIDAFEGEEAADSSLDVFALPRRLSTDSSGKLHERALATADKWLLKVKADFIVWGDASKRGGGGRAKLVVRGRHRAGRNFRSKTIPVDTEAGDEKLRQFFLKAIIFETETMWNAAYREPKDSKIELVRDMVAKCDRLANSSSPDVPAAWKKERSFDAQRLRNALSIHAPIAQADDDFLIEEKWLSESENTISTLDSTKLDEAMLWAETALAISRFHRRRSHYSVEVPKLDTCLGRLVRAEAIFEANADAFLETDRDERAAEYQRHAADCAFEAILCLIAKRETLPFEDETYGFLIAAISKNFDAFLKKCPSSFELPIARRGDVRQLWWSARLLLLHLLCGSESAPSVNAVYSDPLDPMGNTLGWFITLDAEARSKGFGLLALEISSLFQSNGHWVGLRSLCKVLPGASREIGVKGLLNASQTLFVFHTVWNANALLRRVSIQADAESWRAGPYSKEVTSSLPAALEALKAIRGSNNILLEVSAAFHSVALVTVISEKNDRAFDEAYELTNWMREVLCRSKHYPHWNNNLERALITSLTVLAQLNSDESAALEAVSLSKKRLEQRSEMDVENLFRLATSWESLALVTNPKNDILRQKRALSAWQVADLMHRTALENSLADHVTGAIQVKTNLKKRHAGLFDDEDVSSAQVSENEVAQISLVTPDPT